MLLTDVLFRLIIGLPPIHFTGLGPLVPEGNFLVSEYGKLVAVQSAPV